MGVRRESRKMAMQVLFELEMNSQEADAALRRLWAERKMPQGQRCSPSS